MKRIGGKRSRAGGVPSIPEAARSLDPSTLLLATGLNEEEVVQLLTPYGLRDVRQADANIQSMAGEPRTRHQLAGILGEMLVTIAQTADADQALTHWARLLESGINRGALLEYLAGLPRMRDLLCTIFGNSDSLAQTLIRDPMLVYWLAEEQVLTKRPTRAALQRSLAMLLANVTSMELKLEALRRFRRREMLRIGIRDLLRLTDVPNTTSALSDLASVLIQAAYAIVTENLRQRFGIPVHRDRMNRAVETGFAVVAMGKLGGWELNYSSDIDLIYVYDSDEGATRTTQAPQESISNEEYFEQLARALTQSLAHPTQEGHVFRVDLRLRAEGTVGRLTRPLEDYRRYYRSRGETWERLALLKARPIAGSPRVGRAFVNLTRSFVFGKGAATPAGADGRAVLKQVRAVKEMIDDKMADRGHECRNVKLGVGGIREIEFLVQAIQVICGPDVAEILDRSTLGALARFRSRGLLSGKEHQALMDAYIFLRDVEHKLQMVHDLQTHALPDSQEELGRCAIRLGYTLDGRYTALQRFTADHRRHTAMVHSAFRNLFYRPDRSPLLRAALRAAKKARHNAHN
ncbi:MAG: hypothetical protein ACT4OO_04345 [Nitrospiraceae bacterium]